LEPPLIRLPAQRGTTAQLVEEIGHFAVSIPGSDHAYISDRFAGRIPLTEDEDRFEGILVITATTGSPILAEALAWLDCRVHQIHDGSTHYYYRSGARGGNGESDAHLYDRNYRTLMLQAT
jgi:flavin reductase (DIM6/NTAB) family NADH-FMN oxidoreductase RutF